MDKAKKTKTRAKESSAAYFLRLRPKFLDWRPPTEEERLREVAARKEAKERQLAKVTRLEKERQAAKESERRQLRAKKSAP